MYKSQSMWLGGALSILAWYFARVYFGNDILWLVIFLAGGLASASVWSSLRRSRKQRLHKEARLGERTNLRIPGNSYDTFEEENWKNRHDF